MFALSHWTGMEHHDPVVWGRPGAVWQGAGWSDPDVGKGGGGGGHCQDLAHALRPPEVRLYSFNTEGFLAYFLVC